VEFKLPGLERWREVLGADMVGRSVAQEAQVSIFVFYSSICRIAKCCALRRFALFTAVIWILVAKIKEGIFLVE